MVCSAIQWQCNRSRRKAAGDAADAAYSSELRLPVVTMTLKMEAALSVPTDESGW